MTIFLDNQSTNSMIADFQITYNCDCKLHYDVYAYGLKKESLLLKEEDIFEYLDYGMLTCSKVKFLERNIILNSICDNLELLFYTFNEIKAEIDDFIVYNKKLEIELLKNKFDTSHFLLLLDKFTTIMSFRRIPEIYFNNLENKIIELDNSKMPSYAVALNNAIKSLNIRTNSKEIEQFIFEYGYLTNFKIRKSKFENFDYVASIAKKNANTYKKIKPICIEYNGNFIDNEKKKTIYNLTWYEEIRHIYQMRMLRNFRLFFEHYNLDIYKTTYQDLYTFFVNQSQKK